MKKKTSPLPSNVKSYAKKSTQSNAEGNAVQPLTVKEKSVLEFIQTFISTHGISPSYSEIMNEFGLASYNSVQNYLKQLKTKGYIDMPQNQKRAIQVLASHTTIQDNIKHLHQKTGPTSRSLLQTESKGALSLPLLGKVAAGKPLQALNYDEFIQAPSSVIRNPSNSFALQVVGDSMIEEGIFSGDIIFIQEQKTAKNGDLVVASIENPNTNDKEATVKRFYMSAKNHQIELRPANPTMKSMWFDSNQVEIKGIVVGLMRKF